MNWACILDDIVEPLHWPGCIFSRLHIMVIKCLLLKFCWLRLFLAVKVILNWSDVSNQTPSFPFPLPFCSTSYIPSVNGIHPVAQVRISGIFLNSFLLFTCLLEYRSYFLLILSLPIPSTMSGTQKTKHVCWTK